MSVISFEQSAVDWHIGKMVKAARQRDQILKVSAVTARLRAHQPGVTIHPSYVLARLVRAAARKGMAVEVDVPTLD